MYLHIGNYFTVRKKNILGIFDFDKASMEDTTKKFLEAAENEGNLINAWEEFPKSLVVVNDRGIFKTYVTDLSVQALLGRMENHI